MKEQIVLMHESAVWKNKNVYVVFIPTHSHLKALECYATCTLLALQYKRYNEETKLN